MRQAFRWSYQELAKGRDQRALSRAARGSRFARTYLEAKDKYTTLRAFDRKFCEESGCQVLLGVDEVGRGPLAGPLVACCVRLPYPEPPFWPFLRDSKKLQADEREELAAIVERQAMEVSYGVVKAEEFGGDLNLHHLTFEAMRRALSGLKFTESPAALLVDGKFPIPALSIPQRAVIKGDDTSLSVAAASVCAKVYRDRRMIALDKEYPHYGFAKHVGYGTEAHRQAIHDYGPCPEHRSNFLTKILSSAET